MTTASDERSDEKREKAASKESAWIVAGLCLISASSIIVEICLTKFVSYKVYYHFVYAIISTVILSAGFAGVCVQMFPRKFGSANADPWTVASLSARTYAITLMASTFLFCWLPFDPFIVSSLQASPWTSLPKFLMGSAPIALYFLLFSVPFFFAGICVSCTLAVSKRSAATIYFYDLLAAAVGALLCPAAMENLGGYGTIGAASALGMGAFTCFARAALKKQSNLKSWCIFAACGSLLLLYPTIYLKNNCFDIHTMKTAALEHLVFKDLHGINATWWNAVARIDISHSGSTLFFDTTTPKPGQRPFNCRYILVDGAAPTRQMQVDGDPISDARIGNLFWAGPYLAKNDIKHSVIIGAGGGIDILIGKHFKADHIYALELNPSTYKHVLLGQQDSDAPIYQPGLASTKETEVSIHNTEARHFCTSMAPQSVDLVQASAVDTLTAITSGAMAMVENYLYTAEAVKDYTTLLKPGGILSLTHWRKEASGTSLRMFVTYLTYLDNIGIKEPWRYILVTGNDRWANEMMKTTPFTQDELARVRTWASSNGFDIIFDPLQPKSLRPEAQRAEDIYSIIAFLDAPQRKWVLDHYGQAMTPATDDKPYFYKMGKEDFFVSSIYFSTPLALVFLTLGASIVLFLLPLTKIPSGKISSTILTYAGAFATAGFAFLLSEIAVIQLFSVFVGGPIYSLAVVLVCVLAGYASGSWLSRFLKINAATFIALGILLALLFTITFIGLPKLLHSLMPLSDSSRIMVCTGLTFIIYLFTGMPVSLAMTAVKSKHGDLVAWMWGVSCASNAIGAMSFTLIAQQTGIAEVLLISAALYLCASFAFARLAYK